MITDLKLRNAKSKAKNYKISLHLISIDIMVML